ncbi:UNVERIFIED_CONTAM: hypothetical protein B566_EDAN018823, partial [Ephemera danica]
MKISRKTCFLPRLDAEAVRRACQSPVGRDPRAHSRPAAFQLVTIMRFCLFLLGFVTLSFAQDDFLYGTFPPGFLWGVATSAYQIEGAWNESGENIWDRMIHTDPTSIIDGSNADIASDSYNHYLEDAQLAADLG